MVDKLTTDTDQLDVRICHLRQCLEDVSVLAQLEGYKHEQLVMVDEILKQLGKYKECPKFIPIPQLKTTI